MEAAVSITIPKRHPKRVRVMLDSMMETDSGQQKARVRDISRHGMLLETDRSPIVGAVIRLSLGSHSLEGKVAWQEGTWCGVAFSRALDARVWDAFCQQPLMVTMPRQYRHDRIANDQGEPIEVTPRVIRFAQRTAIA
jgi:hypothetical protein